uniref:Uncharacterized protein n=1 Tax=viral metagenome TaxID=1070528 RepID=A0A6H2A3Y4_9ZZZZ
MTERRCHHCTSYRPTATYSGICVWGIVKGTIYPSDSLANWAPKCTQFEDKYGEVKGERAKV